MSLKQFSESFLSHYYWHKDGDQTPWLGENTTYAGTITAQADAADFNESARDNASVEALSATKKVIIKPPNGTVSMELRFRADGTEDDAHILQLFASAGVDHYRWFDQLSMAQGIQVYTADSIYFIDAITSGGEQWPSATSEPGQNDYIASYVFNTHGYDRFWIVASTLDTAGGSPNMSNLYVDWRRH